jgi:hypothetical protein
MDNAFEINSVPAGYGGHNQVEPGGPVALVFKIPIPELPEQVKEYGPVQRVWG